MNIQEFSHQMTRDDHPSRPSQLLQALRELRRLDVDSLRRSRRAGADWGVWTGGEPQDCAAKP